MDRLLPSLLVLNLLCIPLGIWGAYLISASHVIIASSHEVTQVLDANCTGEQEVFIKEKNMLARLTCRESVCDVCYYASVKSKEFQCYPYYWLRWSTYCTESYDLHAWLKVQGSILLGFVVVIVVADLILIVLHIIRNQMRKGYNII